MKTIKDILKQWNKSEAVLVLTLILALVILLLAGCAPCTDEKHKVAATSHKLYADYEEDPGRFICTITVDTIQGHEYIIAEEPNGLCIIHAASCGCTKAEPAVTEKEDPIFDW